LVTCNITRTSFFYNIDYIIMYIDFHSKEKDFANELIFKYMSNVNRAIILDGPRLQTTRALIKFNRWVCISIYELDFITFRTQVKTAPKNVTVFNQDICECDYSCDWLYLDLMTNDCDLGKYPVDLCRYLTITISARSHNGKTLKERINNFVQYLNPNMHLVYYYIYSRKPRGGTMCQIMFSRTKPKVIHAYTFKNKMSLSNSSLQIPINV
jgi:hypothetical protein